MDHYLVISSDCHAGLPNAAYRDWLDPQHRRAFDERLAHRASLQDDMRARGMRNDEFAADWCGEKEEGLRGGWDAARRDRELDADGVVGEVIFPDADAVTAGASAPFGPALGPTAEVPVDLLMARARAHNRWLAELCSTKPDRRAGVAIVPISDVEAVGGEIRRAP